MKKIVLLASLISFIPLVGCGNNGGSTPVVDPLADIIEWKADVTLKVPNGETWYRKRKLTAGETYYMRRHSGSQGFYISAQYPDGTFLEGYNEKYITATMITSWTFCEAKTTWVKFTICNKNTSTGQTSIYWYDY